MKRVILTTGGTGGHIFPALAVAEALRARFPDCQVLFVGGTYGPEADLAARAGLEYVGLPVRGVLGRGLRSVGAAFAMLYGIGSALRIVARFKPDVVVGFGGYAAFAAVLAARLRGCAVALHEQNSIPGMTNRVLGRLAGRIFLSLPDMADAFPAGKTTLTGNPVRESIVRMGNATRGHSGGSRRLLIMGGSLGARAINEAIMKALPALRDAGVAIWHQTGTADWERVRRCYAENGYTEGRVEAFIDDVAAAYQWADLVLCRAGATSVAELAVAGKPSVLVPFPQATHNHQFHNAQFLASCGAALVVEQKTFPETDLAGLLATLLADPDRLATMGAQARAQGRPEAAEAVVDGLLALLDRQAR